MDSLATPTPILRRFTLLDGMILVGSVGISLAQIRWFDPAGEWWIAFRFAVEDFREWDTGQLEYNALSLLMTAMHPAVTMTLGVLALRLRQPRPRWRRVARQPGLVACLALVLSWAVAGAITALKMNSSDDPFIIAFGSPIPPEMFAYLSAFTLFGSTLGGFAVAVAWSTQLLVGRWRAEPTWPDRLGRLVGVVWILMGLVGMYFLRTVSV